MARIMRREGDVSKRSLWQKIKNVALLDVGVLVRGGVNAGSLERLEELLLEADFGVPVTLRLVADVEGRASRGEAKTEIEFHDTLREGVERALRAGNSNAALVVATQAPTVILVVGVNGAGKTTFIGKLASRLVREGRTVLVAAGDTYRAGAIDQLRVWATRAGAQFTGSAPGADPASVAFSAIDAAVARGIDTVIIDTAGRLHTQDGLMTELQKVGKVIAKRIPGAPHETLLVLDASQGQNALAQALKFHERLGVTGLAITKLDGTAKGGILLAIARELALPIRFVALGEGVDDLEEFRASEFVRALIGERAA
jgi:fused signal recognition particle receptor